MEPLVWWRQGKIRRRRESSFGFAAIAACASLSLSATLLFTGLPLHAQKGSEAEKVLIDKAKALESRGRPDIAVQVWQQILLSDPDNPLALEGVARDYRLSGNSAASDQALDKLRKINPGNPNINSIQGLTSNKTRDARLSQAGALAKAGNAEGAMRIYREYYGDHPPDGDIALAYYETLYATANGKQQAITAMRAAAARNPGDPRFIVTLGRMLTYSASTRQEGIKVLREHQDNVDAQNALRQALVWDADNPASAAELREYLKTHANDSDLQGRLVQNEAKLKEMNSGIARTPEEKAAFAALNAHKLTEAESRFQALLDKDANNGRAAAGMGYLRMQQKNFGAAISYLVQAEQNGFRDSSVVEGLATSRFWYTMSEASLSMDVNKLDVAQEKFRAALEMRPRSPEALQGLAGVYSKNQQYNDAATVYEQILRIQPSSPDAWRGLFLSSARAHDNRQALTILGRMPAAMRSNLNRDPEFLQTLAGIYQAEGRDNEAQKTLALALSLPFPESGAELKSGTRLQYAGILMQAKRYDQAAELYKQIINDETSSLPAWMGLITAEHQLQHDNEAIALVEKMPQETYQTALNDAGFLSMLGSMYAQSNQFEIAQTLLERAAKLQSPPSLSVQVQLASIYLQRNDTARAYDLYHQILDAHPDNLDAWRGLIGTLQLTHRDKEALEEIKLIPADIRKQLESDVQFEQSEASLYANAGDTATATALFNNVQRYYASIHQPPPADVDIQSAYLLYNTFNDRELYNALMRLGARTDLTTAQRETIQGLWANWSVRRSAAAFDAGNTARAIDILDAATQAFPDNLAVRKAVGGGYLRAGKTKEALEAYKSVDFQDASASDFQGAIGAALAANDKAQAEIWLRQALDRFPNDASILASAARFEQARGDAARAADYWRASLAAMPQVSPTDRLAHELNHPEAVKPNQRPATPNDLASLLNPDVLPPTRAAQQRQTPLPAYGHDPYDPGAPVVLAPQASNQYTPLQPNPASRYEVPTTTTQPTPQSELNQPVTQPAAPATSASPLPSPFRSATSQDAPTASQFQLPPPPALPATTRSSPSSGAHTKAATTTSRAAKTTSEINPAIKPGASHKTSSTDSSDYQGQMSPSITSSPAQTTQKPTKQQPRTVPVYPQMVPQSLPELAPRKNSDTTRMQAQTQPSPSGPAPQRVDPAAYNGLRLSTEPLNPRVAQAQALLAGETDSQLNPGFSIHYLPNAAASGVNLPSGIASQSQSAVQAAYSNAQYTPSAQDAAAGAYSAPKQAQPIQAPQPLQPEPQVTQQTSVQQSTQTAPTTAKTKHRRRKAAPSGPSIPTLVTAPGEPQQAAPQLPVTDTTAQPQGTQSTTTTGVTDQDLEERNLPPLRGPWIRLTHKPPVQLSPREEAEQQLRQIEGGYSGWLGGTGIIAHRTGNAGYDSLTTLESAFEASVPLSTHARLTFIAKPVFLDAGQADGTAVVTLTSGTVPEPFGTGAGSDGGATDPSANPPAQQNAAGIGGEAQLTLGNLAIAGGYTPYGFQVSNWTARASWRPNAGPFTFTFNRDAVKDTQLSYAGLRDPFSATQVYPGNVWGGVIANAFNVQYAKGDLTSGFYAGAGGQYITGVHVVENRRIDGSLGAYFRVFTDPERGSLNVGVNFFAMHYATNLLGFTYGLGGYFSPQAYFLANVPITWTGHRGTRWHYTVLGSFGVQAFSENKEPLFPLDSAIEIGYNNPSLPSLTSVGANYDVRGEAAYAVHDHWFVGGFASANNSRDYTTGSAGFFVRYLFRSQPSTVAGPTGLFQTDDAHPLRPLIVP